MTPSAAATQTGRIEFHHQSRKREQCPHDQQDEVETRHRGTRTGWTKWIGAKVAAARTAIAAAPTHGAGLSTNR